MLLFEHEKQQIKLKGENNEKITTCAVRFYNYTTKLGAQIQ